MESNTNQQIIIKDGKSAVMSGVNSVLAFDEDYMKIDTSIGIIHLTGKDLVIENLSKEKREILVIGQIYSLEIKKSGKNK